MFAKIYVYNACVSLIDDNDDVYMLASYTY